MYLNVGALTYAGKVFEQVESKTSFDPVKTTIQIGQARICDQIGRGTIEIPHRGDNRRIKTNFTITSSNQEDISHVLSCFFNSQGIIKGDYTFKADLTGNDTADNLIRGQNGRLQFESRSGRIYKATLLSRVLSVLNILGDTDISQHGFGYKTFTIDAEVKNSVIHMEKAYIDADNMGIVSSGWIDPVNDKLELTVLVAPLKTIDTIIQHIPLVNTILSGRLVSFPVRASGKLSDPRVTPLHPSAVGKGMINLFEDLIKAPIRIFQGNKDR